MQGLESLNQFKNFVSSLGGLGRFEDTYMVHAAEGETVVPMEVLDRNPVLKKRLFKSMKALGIDPGRYIVGNDLNSLNPVTGQPEFFFKRIAKALGDISGYAAPIIGAMYGPAAGALAGAGLGAFKRENPGDPSQWQQMALRGGISGLGTNIATGQGFTPFGGLRGAYGLQSWDPRVIGKAMMGKTGLETGQTGAGWEGALKTGGDDSKWKFMEKYFPEKVKEAAADDIIKEANRLVDKAAADGRILNYDTAVSVAKDTVESATGIDISWKDLLGVGALGTVGLGALIGEPEDITIDESQMASYTPHGLSYEELLKKPTIDYDYNIPFAAKGGIMDLQGGGESIGPGTGTSDSIPAMLSDGEFVMTADAVRGAGGGDRREGARRMYEAMNRLEARV